MIRSNEFTRVEVQLMRLVNGDLPEYPIFVVDSVPVNTFYLDDLLALRMPDADAKVRMQRGLGKQEIEAQLQFWSDSLRRQGDDLLRGDLSVLDDLEAIVRARAAQSPPEVSVWLPEGTSSDEAASEAARVRATVPSEVSVATRWYRPGRNRGLGDRDRIYPSSLHCLNSAAAHFPGHEGCSADYEWPTGYFSFVWGCVWGDDSSWKVQFLDLSRIRDGELTREERFGYVILDSGEPGGREALPR